MEANGRELFSLCCSLKVDEFSRLELRLGQEEGQGVAPREPGWGGIEMQEEQGRNAEPRLMSHLPMLSTPLLLLQGWASSGKSLS